MYTLYFDCGTTKTRGYLLRDGGVIADMALQLGSKEVSVQNDPTLLRKAMQNVMLDLCSEAGADPSMINDSYASGMITSPYGLKEVAHIAVPVDVYTLKKNITILKKDDMLRKDIKLIPGVKTAAKIRSIDELSEVNNVRGEEIETFGAIHHIPTEWRSEKCLIIIPGSHTHSLLIDNGIIIDVLSVFSGEMYAALSKNTILAGSISTVNNQKSPDEHMIELAHKYYTEHGISRAVYLVHASKIFSIIDNDQRRDLLSGIIVASSIDSICYKLSNEWKDVNKVVIYADGNIAELHRKMINKNIANDLDIFIIDRQNINCSIEGLNILMEA